VAKLAQKLTEKSDRDRTPTPTAGNSSDTSSSVADRVAHRRQKLQYQRLRRDTHPLSTLSIDADAQADDPRIANYQHIVSAADQLRYAPAFDKKTYEAQAMP